MSAAADISGFTGRKAANNPVIRLDAPKTAPYWSRVMTAGFEASWRSGYAEDCKSLNPGSIPGEASKPAHHMDRAIPAPVVSAAAARTCAVTIEKE